MGQEYQDPSSFTETTTQNGLRLRNCSGGYNTTQVLDAHERDAHPQSLGVDKIVYPETWEESVRHGGHGAKTARNTSS